MNMQFLRKLTIPKDIKEQYPLSQPVNRVCQKNAHRPQQTGEKTQHKDGGDRPKNKKIAKRRCHRDHGEIAHSQGKRQKTGGEGSRHRRGDKTEQSAFAERQDPCLNGP